ncbi:THAP domain containing 6 [Plakobranchus ocellatus]|uniref:THAP domain containing 6 n=1 Tax=Plakobranchus ocellatus TaxID=259542 RepID=A0AAV4BRR5_9GAST|nr:THAP domain containing 6 [Plakobranchus ocellatus]
MFKGNKLNELKGSNQKFSRGGAGVGFQPTITHHYVFHVSMGRSWRWPPVRHHIAEHASARARSPWTSHPRYDKASLASNQTDQKLIHMCIPAS